MHALLWVEQMSGAKVYNFDGALLLGIYQNVFRFEVSVRNIQTMEIIQRNYSLSNVKQSNVVWKNLFSPQKSKHLSSGHVLKSKVQVRFILEALNPK